MIGVAISFHEYSAISTGKIFNVTLEFFVQVKTSSLRRSLLRLLLINLGIYKGFHIPQQDSTIKTTTRQKLPVW